MPLSKQAVRNLLESDGVGGDSGRFTNRVLHLMGLADQQGRRYRDDFGNPVLRNPKSASGAGRLRPAEISLRTLAESLLGDSFATEMEKIPAAIQMRALLEDNGAGSIGASSFANINAFTAVTAGLLEVAILERWQSPEFIADKLAPTEDTKLFEGRKSIGAARMGDVAEERLPGMPTKRVQFGERWITQPRTIENSAACEVTQEAVYLDLTGQVLEEANGVADWLRYRKEIRVIDAFIGVTNTYAYKGSSYNTYLTGSTWDNDLSNELLHYNNVENVLIKFRNMTDQETGTHVIINPNKVLVNLEKYVTAQAIFGVLAGDVQYRDIPGSTTNPQMVRSFQSPYRGQFEILHSPLVYSRCVAANGLNLSASNAGKYWWTWGDGFMRYAQNWPLRTQTAAPNTSDMIDRGVVLFVKADERGVPYIVEPRKAVRSKN